MADIAVLGAGGWGTALAVMADRCGHRVRIWSAFPEELEQIQKEKENKRLLPGIPVPESVRLVSRLQDTADCPLYILAVPSVAVRETARKLASVAKPGACIVNVGKGLEDGTKKRLSQVIEEEIPTARIVALSGPSHAEEVGRNIPTTVVASSHVMEAAEYVQDTLMNPNFRIYTNSDLIGVELGGTVKNVIALAAGICDGMGLGDNSKAALLTRGIAEIARLGVAMGANVQTFAGLTGIGDLIVTCTSMHSRNRRAGILVGQGVAPEEALKQVGTVEGYYAAKVVHELAQERKVEMPISEKCYQVMYQNASPKDAISQLMARPKKHENEYLVW